MKIQWKKLIVCIAIPLIVGGLSAYLSRAGMEEFQTMAKPPLTPPAWLFPVVWTILYILMGIASYIVCTSDAPKNEINSALTVYGCQLAVNFFWSILFFCFKQYLFSFLWLIFLWILIFATLTSFYQIKKTAGYLLIPYLVWVTFAGYLNLGVYFLN